MEGYLKTSRTNEDLNPPSITNYFKDTTRADNAAISNFYHIMMEEQAREVAIEKGVRLAAERKQEIQKQTDDESKLVLELVELKRRRFIDQKQRQQIRETSQELKELEVKLRAAYVGKALAAQIAENEAIRQHEKFLHERESELLEAARVKDSEYRIMKLEEERQRKRYLREEMLEQMAERAQVRARKYEEFLREKKFMDEIIRKIYEEEMAEMREAADRRAKFKSDINNFLCAQKEWKEQHKQQTDDEDKKLVEFLKMKEEEEKKNEQKKMEERVLREQISEKMGQAILSIDEEKRKHRDLLLDLQIAEVDEKAEQSIRQTLEKQLRERIQTRLQLEKQREDNTMRRLMEEEEDRMFHAEQMRLFAERDKLDLMSDEKQRRKKIEHRRDIQLCLAEKKKRRAVEVATLLKQRDDDLDEEHRRQQLIEEERIRMLKEHAKALMGFLPPGILRESDREFLPLPRKC